MLAIQITRSGFEAGLAQSCLSQYDASHHASLEEWQARRDSTSVRIQWDPERDLHHRPTGVRSLQMGIGGPAVQDHVDEWTVSIEHITDLVTTIGGLVGSGGRPVVAGRGALSPHR